MRLPRLEKYLHLFLKSYPVYFNYAKVFRGAIYYLVVKQSYKVASPQDYWHTPQVLVRKLCSAMFTNWKLVTLRAGWDALESNSILYYSCCDIRKLVRKVIMADKVTFIHNNYICMSIQCRTVIRINYNLVSSQNIFLKWTWSSLYRHILRKANLLNAIIVITQRSTKLKTTLAILIPFALRCPILAT